MSLEQSLNALKGSVDQLIATLAGGAAPAPARTTSAGRSVSEKLDKAEKAVAEASKTTTAPKAEAPAEETAEEAVDTDKQAEVNAKTLELAKDKVKGGRAVVEAILKKYKVAKTSELKPAQWDKYLADVNEKLNAAPAADTAEDEESLV